MTATPQTTAIHKYSDHLEILHDETAPTGYLGRGTHYSVLRTSFYRREPDGRTRTNMNHDFAVIWDEDHDERVIQVVEALRRTNLLWRIIAIGERKGKITLVLPDEIFNELDEKRPDYEANVGIAAWSVDDDPWSIDICPFSKSEGIISDHKSMVRLYLDCIMMLWRLGIKPIMTPREERTMWQYKDWEKSLAEEEAAEQTAQ